MKKIQIIVGLFTVLMATSCIKNEEVLFDDQTVIEFDAASWNANDAGLNYPILTRIPGYGRALATNDPLLSRTSPGVKKFRLNVVGQRQPTPIRVFYLVAAGTTAVEGVHYKKLSGEMSIPPNSSFAELEVEILDPGANTPATRDLVLTLTGSVDGVKSSANYNTIALRIAQ